MLKIKFIITLGILFVHITTLAQNKLPEQNNELDKKYTPPQSSIFNNLGPKNNSSSSPSSNYDDEVTIKNAIKFVSTAIFRQKLIFNYQREVYNGLSLNIGFGKAFGRDYIQQVGTTLLEFSNFQQDRLNAYEIIDNSLFKGTSPYFSIGPRIYFSGNSFENGFVEFNYAYEKTEYTLNAQINGYDVRGSRGCDFVMHAFNFGFGYTFVNNHFTHDILFNVGMKTFNFTQFDYHDNTNQMTGAIERYYIRTSKKVEARLIPTINLTYAFGFGF